MATEKTITTRVQMKTDTASNWGKATNFTPKKGEIIVYSGNPPRIKVGDGTTKVSALPFATSSVYVGDTEPTGDYDLWIDTSSDTSTGRITAVIFTQDEKTKLAGIAANANNYSLPTAGSTLGGVKTTSTVSSTTGLTAVPIISGVPYYKDTNTTYTAGAGLELSSTQFKHKNAVTAKTAYGSTATTASANGGSITVTDVKYDAQGHITGSTDRKITLSQTTYTLAGLGAAAASHTHGMITSDGKLTNQSNKVMVVDSTGSITAYGGTAVRSMIGAEAANTCLPLAGGTMTGAINFGGATRGVVWTTANGTIWSFRPYYSGNIFQLTLTPTGKAEYGALNIDANGNADFSSEIAAKGYIKGARFRAEADNDYPTYEFKANSQTNYGGMIQMGSTNMFGFYEYPKEFDGQSTRYYEGYRLPEPATGLTANKNYKILTDKVPVTVAQGGTGATTAAQALTNLGAVPLAGGATISGNMTFGGNLWVSNDKSAGGYVKIWEDNEGGNIAIGSKSGKEFQIDAYNDTTLRIYASDDSGNIRGMSFGRTNGGSLSCDGQMYCSGGKTVYHTGNIIYSSTQPTGSTGAIWLKPI